MPEAVPAPTRRRARRRSTRPPMRNVAAQIPADKADEFYDLCAAMGTSGAAVLREAALAYISEHQHMLATVDQRELPLTG